MSELGKILTAARHRRGLSMTRTAWEVSNRLGHALDANYISRLERGNIKRPDKERLRIIAEVLDLDSSEVLRLADYDAGVPDVVGLPIADVSAGPGAWVDEMFYLPKKIVGSRRVAAYRVRGTSMEPGIPEGSIVIIDLDRPPRLGDIVIAWTDNGGVLKRIVSGKGGLYLEGANGEAVPITESTRIAGVVFFVGQYIG
jgi:SOS-response transcriptional repressor LexA